MSIQVAILKVLASHGSGRATLASLKRDIAILAASGPDWNARIKRLASRVPAIDIFGAGHVLRDDEGWQITPAGREFLRALEAVTQDNRPAETNRRHAQRAAAREGALIVVGHRFKNRPAAIAIRLRRDGISAGFRATIRTPDGSMRRQFQSESSFELFSDLRSGQEQRHSRIALFHRPAIGRAGADAREIARRYWGSGRDRRA